MFVCKVWESLERMHIPFGLLGRFEHERGIVKFFVAFDFDFHFKKKIKNERAAVVRSSCHLQGASEKRKCVCVCV